MTYSPTQTLTVDQFIAQYGDESRYELADGELIDREPTGPHETVSGKLAIQIGIAIAHAKSPWFIPRTCLVQPFADVATARRPDIRTANPNPFRFAKSLDKALWLIQRRSRLYRNSCKHPSRA